MKAANVGRILANMFTHKTIPDDSHIPEHVSWEVLVTALSEVTGVPVSDLESPPAGHDALDFVVQRCKSYVERGSGRSSTYPIDAGAVTVVVVGAKPTGYRFWQLMISVGGGMSLRVLVPRATKLDALIHHHKVSRPDLRGCVKLAESFPTILMNISRRDGTLFGDIHRINN